MSDAPGGEGWWMASDGKWYPPQPPQPPAAPPVVPEPTAQQPATPPPPPGSAPNQPVPSDQIVADQPGEEKKNGRGKLVAITLLILLLAAGATGAVILLSGNDDNVESSTDSNEQDGPGGGGIGGATKDLVDDGPITFDKEYQDALEAGRTQAHYTFVAPDSARLALTVANDKASSASVYVTLESRGDRFAGFRVKPGADEAKTIYLKADGGAPFDLRFTEGPAKYTFKVALEIADDAGKGGDAGDDFDSAFELTAGKEYSGSLGGQDRTDHYLLALQPGADFTLDTSVQRSSEHAVYVTVELEGSRILGKRVQPGAEDKFSLLLGDKDEGTLEIIFTEGPADYAFTGGFAAQHDGGSDGDVPGELADARRVETAPPVTGQVAGGTRLTSTSSTPEPGRSRSTRPRRPPTTVPIR